MATACRTWHSRRRQFQRLEFTCESLGCLDNKALNPLANLLQFSPWNWNWFQIWNRIQIRIRFGISICFRSRRTKFELARPTNYDHRPQQQLNDWKIDSPDDHAQRVHHSIINRTGEFCPNDCVVAKPTDEPNGHCNRSEKRELTHHRPRISPCHDGSQRRKNQQINSVH